MDGMDDKVAAGDMGDFVMVDEVGGDDDNSKKKNEEIHAECSVNDSGNQAVKTEDKDSPVEVKWSEVMGQKGHRIRMQEKAEKQANNGNKNNTEKKLVPHHELERQRLQSMEAKEQNNVNKDVKTKTEPDNKVEAGINVEKKKTRLSFKQRRNKRLRREQFIREKQELRQRLRAERNHNSLMDNMDEMAVRFHQSEWNRQCHDMGPPDYEWADLMSGPPGWRMDNTRPGYWEENMIERERMFDDRRMMDMRRESRFNDPLPREDMRRRPYPYGDEFYDRERLLQSRDIELEIEQSMENQHLWEMETMRRRREGMAEDGWGHMTEGPGRMMGDHPPDFDSYSAGTMDMNIQYEPPLGQKLEKCPIPGCFIECNNLRYHAHTKHIPSIFKSVEDSDKTSQKGITPQRVAALRAMKMAILGPQGTFNALMELVNGIGIGQEEAQKENQLTSSHWAMIEVCRDQDWPSPKHFSLSPLNSPAALIHWRPLLILLSLLDHKRRQSIMSAFPINSETVTQETELSVGQTIKKTIPSLVPENKREIPSLMTDLVKAPSHLSDVNHRLTENRRDIPSLMSEQIPTPTHMFGASQAHATNWGQGGVSNFNPDPVQNYQGQPEKKRRNRNRGKGRNNKPNDQNSMSGNNTETSPLMTTPSMTSYVRGKGTYENHGRNFNNTKQESNTNGRFSLLYGTQPKTAGNANEMYDQHYENRICNQLGGRSNLNNQSRSSADVNINIGCEYSDFQQNQNQPRWSDNTVKGFGQRAMSSGSYQHDRVSHAMDRAFQDDMKAYGRADMGNYGPNRHESQYDDYGTEVGRDFMPNHEQNQYNTQFDRNSTDMGGNFLPERGQNMYNPSYDNRDSFPGDRNVMYNDNAPNNMWDGGMGWGAGSSGRQYPGTW